MSRYWSDFVRNLKPYVPGEQPSFGHVLKLNTNENPYGPSASVLEVLKHSEHDLLRLYPDPNAIILKDALADRYNVCRDEIFVGNGSDEVLAHAFHALLKHDRPVRFPDITYGFYPVYCDLYGIPYEPIPLSGSMEIELDRYFIPSGGVVLPNPNAPTGIALPLKEIERLLERQRECVVVIDEAYVDFGAESAVALTRKFQNLLVVQTFSKSRSLAGLRVGFAIGHPDLIDALNRVKNSFNSYPVGRLSLLAAVAALEDGDHFDRTRQMIVDSREHLAGSLAKLGFVVLPSLANFLFIAHPSVRADALDAHLRSRQILVRHFSIPRADQFLRVTVGTDDQCRSLMNALEDIFRSKSL